MTSKEAYDAAVQARIDKIVETIEQATKTGLFEMRIEKLTPEQVKYLEENGFKVREIKQRAGSEYDINWEQ